MTKVTVLGDECTTVCPLALSLIFSRLQGLFPPKGKVYILGILGNYKGKKKYMVESIWLKSIWSNV